tara:strand:+ start:55560 stop:56408 length:849 start_codon:yes stop_codon:yes gene_type:complete
MKKLILLSALLIFACSSDDSSNDDTTINCYGYLLEDYSDSILPSTITIVDAASDNLTSVINYSYNGNKILSSLQSISDDQGLNEEIEKFYTYSENRVSAISTYFDGELSGTIQVEYNLQGMPSALLASSVVGVEYTYQTDCSILISYPLNVDVDSMPHFVEIDDNGNISYAYSDIEDHCFNSVTTEYDNYNNPFKNVTGHSNLGNIISIDSSISSNSLVHIFGSLGLNNNPISHNSSSTQCDNPTSQITTYSYDYNDAGYPVNVIISVDGVVYETVTIEYND